MKTKPEDKARIVCERCYKDADPSEGWCWTCGKYNPQLIIIDVVEEKGGKRGEDRE